MTDKRQKERTPKRIPAGGCGVEVTEIINRILLGMMQQEAIDSVSYQHLQGRPGKESKLNKG